jgi:hypothetical protein
MINLTVGEIRPFESFEKFMRLSEAALLGPWFYCVFGRETGLL